MGVDYSVYALYGIELKGPHWFMTEEQYGDSIDGNYQIIDSPLDYISQESLFVISDKIVNKYGLEVIYDQYGFNWQVMGLYFLADTPEGTIDKLKNIQDKWKNLLKDLDIPLEGHEARIMCDCYAW